MFELTRLTAAVGELPVTLGKSVVVIRFRRPDSFEMLDLHRSESPFNRARRAWRKEYDATVARLRLEAGSKVDEDAIVAEAHELVPLLTTSEDYLPRLRFIESMIVAADHILVDGQPIEWKQLEADQRMKFIRAIPQQQLWDLYGKIVDSVSLDEAEKNV